ncbi:hypothetical protein ES703_81505 [subsurface metagenome]
MRIKVYNRIFSEAMYSFHNLKLYYEHVVILLDQASERIKEAGRETEVGYKEKGREYDKEFWGKFHKVFEETYPSYFHNSFLISACSLFEHQAQKLCAFIQEEHKVPVGWDDMEGPVSVKTRRFLGYVGIALQDDPPKVELPPPDFKPTTVYDETRVVIRELWQELENYYRIRNCIVHHNGLVQKTRGAARIQEYATARDITVERDGQLEVQLNEGFNKGVCDTMGKFFGRLRGAYYSMPLPD